MFSRPCCVSVGPCVCLTVCLSSCQPDMRFRARPLFSHQAVSHLTSQPATPPSPCTCRFAAFAMPVLSSFALVSRSRRVHCPLTVVPAKAAVRLSSAWIGSHSGRSGTGFDLVDLFKINCNWNPNGDRSLTLAFETGLVVLSTSFGGTYIPLVLSMDQAGIGRVPHTFPEGCVY